MNQTLDAGERRRSNRFPVERAVRFKLISRRADLAPGSGQTINMSSRGVLFSTDRELAPGKRVELAISWPAQLDDTCPLKMVAKGRIVRSGPGIAAVEIHQHEFRTAGATKFR